ncbi:MAG: hypothetical protein WCS73_02060 [Lentisphaeria bacterium]
MKPIKVNASVYKILFCIVAFVLAVAAFFYSMVLLPQQKTIESYQSDLQQIYKRMDKSNYPLDMASLQQIYKKLLAIQSGDKKQKGLKEINDLLDKRTQNMYAEIIKEKYGTRSDFIRRVTRLDFQEEFFIVKDDFEKNGFELDPSVLGISTDTLSDYTYQLMLKLWTLKTLRQCLTASGVRVCKNAQQKTKISLLPMKAYFESPKEEKPYLLEFPVKFAIEGNFSQIQFFIKQLITEPYFLPVQNFEIFSIPPKGEKMGQLRVNLKCAGYFSY